MLVGAVAGTIEMRCKWSGQGSIISGVPLAKWRCLSANWRWLAVQWRWPAVNLRWLLGSRQSGVGSRSKVALARGKVALAGQGLDHGRAAVHVVDLVQRPLVQPGPGPVVVLRVCGTKRDEMQGGG